MSNPQTIAQDYIAFWNAGDPAQRRALFEAGWAPDATYVDPVMRGAGATEISGLIAGVQDRFPGFRFQLLGAPNGHGDYVRFSWSLGPDGAPAPIEGSDVVKLKDGRIAEVIGFLDKVPS
jgi:hypothetical protein